MSASDPHDSDAPRERARELREESREEFVRTFLRRGADLTRELLHENERLARESRRLADENAALRKKLSSDDAVRELVLEVERLEEDRARLVTENEAQTALTDDHAARYSVLEDELSTLANVYVASHRLNATLVTEKVIAHVGELLGQLVGALAYGVYLLDEPDKTLVAVASAGLDGTSAPSHPSTFAVDGRAPASATHTLVERVFLTGVAHFADDAQAPGVAACVPLRADERIVGALVVFRLLPHKPAFEAVDHELFKLLSAHAAPAFYGAQLFEGAGSALPRPNASSTATGSTR